MPVDTVLLAWLFPMLMIGVVISAGNHYVLDVAGSAALFTASIAMATVWQRLLRRRPGAPTLAPTAASGRGTQQ